MAIYIHRNGEQFGPYEEQAVIDQVRTGQLSPEDMGIRQGEKDWQKLRVMFPDATPTTPSPDAIPPPPVIAEAAPAAAVQYEAVYRGTTLQKVFFGLCLLMAIVALAATGFFFYTLMSSSGDLQADLTKMSYKILTRNAAGGIVVGAFFTFLAFLLTFKRRLIRSNGPRIALRVIFILILLVGLGNLAAGAISYFTYNAPYKPAKSESNELLKALEQGSDAVGPYELAVILLPIGGGLMLLGLSGILMTKKLRTE